MEEPIFPVNESKTFTTSFENQSPELGNLFGALSKAQLEMELAKTDNMNPFFKSKYADLASIVKASRPYLAKNGLCVIQHIQSTPEANYLFTRLGHLSGEWIQSKVAITPQKNDIQSFGSFITYLKRYTYASLVGVVSADEDDDGEQAMERKTESVSVSSKISKDQLSILSNELEGHEEILENLLKGFEITKLADLKSSHFLICLKRVREIKESLKHSKEEV